MVEFGQEDYTVAEGSAAAQEVCLVVTGMLERSVVLSLSTNGITATGMCLNMCLGFKTLFM